MEGSGADTLLELGHLAAFRNSLMPDGRTIHAPLGQQLQRPCIETARFRNRRPVDCGVHQRGLVQLARRNDRNTSDSDGEERAGEDLAQRQGALKAGTSR